MLGELKKLALKELRRKGKKRRAVGGKDGRGRLRNMTRIDERPKEIDSRDVPGHWEGDFVHREEAQIGFVRTCRAKDAICSD